MKTEKRLWPTPEVSQATADRITDLERRLAMAHQDASDCCDGYEGQLQMLTQINRDLNERIAEQTTLLESLEKQLTLCQRQFAHCDYLLRQARGEPKREA